MNVRILYFASLREKLGTGNETLELSGDVSNIAGVLEILAARGGEWASLPTVKNLKFAVNQEMARADSPVRGGDEVAFFPPVTGG